MIDIKLTKKIGWWIFARKVKTKMSIASNWGDIKYKQWKQLQETEDDMEIAAILSGMPIETIKQLSESGLHKVISILSFVRNPMLLNKYTAPNKIVINNRLSIPLVEDITEKTWGQKLYLHQVLQDNDENLTAVLPEIILSYAQPFIDNSKFNLDRVEQLTKRFDDLIFVDLYSTAMNYVQQLKAIIKNEVDTLDSNPTSDQINAGIKMFQEYGVMNTVKAACGGGANWPSKIDDVMNWEYNIALLSMQMSKTQGIFDENYRKVLKRKQK